MTPLEKIAQLELEAKRPYGLVDKFDVIKLVKVAKAASKDHPDNCCGHCDICEALKELGDDPYKED